MTFAVGIKSCSSPTRFDTNSELSWVTPVMLPVGRLRLLTRPSVIGSPAVSKTIGMSAVAALAARAGRTRRSEHSHPAAYQIGDHLRQSFVVAVGPPIFDRYVLTFYISGVSQTLTKRARKTCRFR